MQCAYRNLISAIPEQRAVIVVSSRLADADFYVAVLNLSVQMRRGATLQPVAQLLVISRLLLSPDMLSSDVAAR